VVAYSRALVQNCSTAPGKHLAPGYARTSMLPTTCSIRHGTSNGAYIDIRDGTCAFRTATGATVLSEHGIYFISEDTTSLENSRDLAVYYLSTHRVELIG
jgi:hypothetical protein